MIAQICEALLIALLVLDLLALGTSRIQSVIRYAAGQGIILGLFSLLHPGEIRLHAVLVAVLTLALKGVVIPQMLNKAMRQVEIKREVEPFIGLGASMFLCVIGSGVAFFLAQHLPLHEEARISLLVPTALTTIWTGFLLLTTRLKAISQVLGYLTLENGIFLFGALLMEAVPLLVELCVLLDLVVAIFIMGILLNHIQRAFSSIDTRELTHLREE